MIAQESTSGIRSTYSSAQGHFHTKVLQDGPTPKIGAMRDKYLWVGSMSPNKETFANDPAHMKNNASEKNKGSNVAADFWYLGGVKKSLF